MNTQPIAHSLLNFKAIVITIIEIQIQLFLVSVNTKTYESVILELQIPHAIIKSYV